jgi:hypothetical protein
MSDGTAHTSMHRMMGAQFRSFHETSPDRERPKNGWSSETLNEPGRTADNSELWVAMPSCGYL